MDEYTWYEIWIEDVSRPPYVLILFGDSSGKLFDVYDLKEKYICYSASSYQDAQFWLNEDEYIKVDGRMEMD